LTRSTTERVTLDIDSSESPVHGAQQQSAYNGHFESVCYHPLFVFNPEGDCLAAKLRPGNVPLVRYRSFEYQAASWDRPRRVIAKVEHHLGELFPRVGFIVTTLTGTNRAVVRFYNQRGTAEQWIRRVRPPPTGRAYPVTGFGPTRSACCSG
jgi:Transposase DDE domain group 1